MYTVLDVIAEVKDFETGAVSELKLHTTAGEPRPLPKSAGRSPDYPPARHRHYIPVCSWGYVLCTGCICCGKTVISQALSKYANTNGIIYVGCENVATKWQRCCAIFPSQDNAQWLSDVMARTCLVANIKHACRSSRGQYLHGHTRTSTTVIGTTWP